MQKTVGRFAPSPSGRMHMGNVFASLMAWLCSRSRGGEMVMRIEDLDTVRCTEHFAELIKSDLTWLGLDWDREMPYQHTRSDVYAEVLKGFRARGLTFDCRCTRGDLHAASAPHASDGHSVYTGTCRYASDDVKQQIALQPHCVRLIVPDETITFCDTVYGEISENLALECGDFVLQKADGSYAYQLAVVVDDIAGGVNQVVRGCDLLGSTARQIYLHRLQGAAAPEYCHVPMLVGEGGRKLSKRDLDLDLGVLRQSVRPQRIIGALAYFAGLTDKLTEMSANELLQIFDIKKLGKGDIAIDPSVILGS